MHRDHTIRLLIIQLTQPDQFSRDLANRLDFREIVHRRHVLVGQVIDHEDVVLQAVLDQAADGFFSQDPAGGIMGIVDRQRAALVPGRILPGQLIHFPDHGVDIQFQRGSHRNRMHCGKALFVRPAQVGDHHFGDPAVKAQHPQRRTARTAGHQAGLRTVLSILPAKNT